MVLEGARVEITVAVYGTTRRRAKGGEENKHTSRSAGNEIDGVSRHFE